MSKTGTHFYTDLESGRKFKIEVIDNSQGKQSQWGDIDPATKTVQGSYGNKNIGSITEDESTITKENGYDEIYEIKGESPYSFIEKLLKK